MNHIKKIPYKISSVEEVFGDKYSELKEQMIKNELY